jgi:hypothetical protein
VTSAELAVPGEHGLTAEALLAGPRGRSLCANVLDDRLTAPGGRVPRAWAGALHAIRTGDAARGARKLSECVGIAGLAGTPLDASALMVGMRAAVDFAAYWQPPDAEDEGFAGEPVRAALRPVAAAVVVALAGLPEVRWWAERADRSGQRYTQFLGANPLPEPLLTGAAESVAAWLADTRADERDAHSRPEDPDAPYGGQWWSAPVWSRLPVTTRRLPAHGAVGLALVEDGAGWRSACCWPVAVADGARVYEVSGPDEWAALVGRYPLDVSKSRRHEWWQATGRADRWLIPDYAAVAADWDAVHVSVSGYLTTAGIAIPAGTGAHTMLAGWDPDATWWLNDVLSFSSSGSPELWQADDQAPFGWTRAQ